MVFSSSIFLFAFLPICLAVYYWIPKDNIKLKNFILFIMSLFFYAWGEPVYVIIMILSIIFNYIFAILVEKYRESNIASKSIISLMLIYNLGMLFVFKYLGFFVTNINSLFKMNLNIPQIALPIGISFFTFQAISYVIDVYRKTDSTGEIITAQKSIINVGLYIAFFPQLIAGPIVRYKTIADQLIKRDENFDKFGEGTRRFFIGLSKKTLLANNLALIADNAFSYEASQLSTLFAWLGAVAYTFQILFDFSGYSDMAIGLGKMFGFEFMENFNYPYISKSVGEFWRRWHISLGNWFKDYIYIPLGGNRHGLKRTILNSFVVWLFTGIWHGANWTFISWGLYYFIFLSIENVLKRKKLIKDNLIVNIFRHLYLIVVVIIGWVLFRADTIGQAFEYIRVMFSMNNCTAMNEIAFEYITQNRYFLIFAFLLSTPIASYLDNIIKSLISKCSSKKTLFILADISTSIIYILLFIINISYIVKNTYNPFIYFNF